MKLYVNKNQNEQVMLVHLFDLPYLATQGKWSPTLGEALEEQYGYEHPFYIEEEDLGRCLQVFDKEDQNTIQKEKGIFDCTQMTQEIFGRDLYQEVRNLQEKVVRNQLFQEPFSKEEETRLLQLAYTKSKILESFGEQVLENETKQGYSFRKTIKNTMLPKSSSVSK